VSPSGQPRTRHLANPDFRRPPGTVEASE
jgi:hypothetical protein